MLSARDLRLLDLTGGSLPRTETNLGDLEPVVAFPKRQQST
jgi:hypothetical protein